MKLTTLIKRTIIIMVALFGIVSPFLQEEGKAAEKGNTEVKEVVTNDTYTIVDPVEYTIDLDDGYIALRNDKGEFLVLNDNDWQHLGDIYLGEKLEVSIKGEDEILSVKRVK